MADTESFKYATVRQKILDAVRTDLIGPREQNEKLNENPAVSYITGMLYPTDSSVKEDEDSFFDVEFSQKDFDSDPESTESSIFEEEQPEEKVKSGFQKPSSLGISFYVKTGLPKLNALIRWGKYQTGKEEIPQKEETFDTPESSAKAKTRTTYCREQKEETVEIPLSEMEKTKIIPLTTNSNIYLYVIKMPLVTGYTICSVYLRNNCEVTKGESEIEKIMFQVQLELSAQNNSAVFVPEYICRNDKELDDEYFYKGRPVYARGRGCAASWQKPSDINTNLIRSVFIPDYEIAGVSPEINEMGGDAFSMLRMGKPAFRSETSAQLKEIVLLYDSWISKTISKTQVEKSKTESVMEKCRNVSKRISEGISIVENNDAAQKAFEFMNQAMYLQRSISNYSKDSGKGVVCSLGDYMKEIPEKGRKQDHSHWRPFQIAFILMNLRSIIDKNSPEREIVDLLYFPTGGGKTEAYLGLIAFTIAYRRITREDDIVYEKDGGVTVILRYTLRLLTTQQKDRLLKLIIAMDMLREKQPDLYGKERISIGFWVGGGVTPNGFEKWDYDENDPRKIESFIWKVSRQVIRCPFCGQKIPKENFIVSPKERSVKIYCANDRCCYSESHKRSIPVYLVDDEIYAKCPTVVISTVDKFARLPWSEETGLLFGRTDRYCERCGHLAVGEKHPMSHRAENTLPSANVSPCKPFYPPELIIQDELHLITGPLGTIYGGYETVIEEMCTVIKDGKRIKPKYIASTATIKNATEQIKALYARKEYCQFPPDGLDIRNSFFVKEIPLEEKPFRQYAGICASGQSVKTTLIRLYSIILQKVLDLSQQEEYTDYVDPYWTLIGYFNSLRELGGARRLLDDDITHRIHVLKNIYGFSRERYLNNFTEITSCMKSTKITQTLELLATEYNRNSQKQDCFDAVIATNMIAVGMDVDRLGLMVVVGQPKQNSEYIQATSRVGRKWPGIIFTVYNPYRPRDLSNYENFTGFHSQMYRYVEGTTVTPFAARARDRDLHALVVSLLRLQYKDLADNNGAGKLSSSMQDAVDAIQKKILERVSVVAPDAYEDTKTEIENFISDWKEIASSSNLYYTLPSRQKGQRLLVSFEEPATFKEKPTLRSMRDVEQASTLYYYNPEAVE